ncbi:hypothetical protein UA08_05621 [Talaromyces atroroseus]|uniref:F-box domain-containing protein n=1 Tax=Talaromyces atroroseus TaxID=1441469 RepID=A0A225AV25_TALAT|nr:hypothetical protein UA08_05621 [Talaromyces atroroseus]OKL58826.1 hypothetical protein UA08_05621 [Talaromyces atroroseus]
MEAIPPSYEHAIMKDALAIIADYIPSADLCAASLVSRRWHAIFNPHIWGDPASHFGTQNDAVYGKRPLVKSILTHTLHLPPALSEIYGGPRSDWLRDLLDFLPRLQSLRVSTLPFFDHNSTMNLKLPSDPTRTQDYPPYNLRLLLADREPNTTSIGLATALSRFPALVYLDMSYTSPVRDQLVFSVLSALPDLQVLKLRAIGLRDVDAEFLANAIGTRVRVLDIRNNMLTDTAVRSLLQACFMSEEAAQNQANALDRQRGRASQDFTSSLLRHPELDKRFFESLTHPLTGRSIFENLAHSGITHLYISDNRLTIEGVAALLASKRLHLLDAGSVDTARKLTQDQSLLLSPGTRYDFNTVPGAEKLVPILGAYAKYQLTHIRINHTVATKDAPAQNENSIVELLPELPADELGVHHFHAELGTSHKLYELPAENDVLYELEDTSVSSVPNNHTDKGAKHDQYLDEPLLPRRNSAFAAEVVDDGDTVNEKEPEQNAHTAFNKEAESTLRTKKILNLLAKRPRTEMLPLRHGLSPTIPYLHPSHIPHVKTLILTDVPSHVRANSPILSSLIRFITACSDETLLAKLKARADYSFPPGRDRLKAEQEHAKSLFALECLVLEITPVTRTTTPKALGTWKPQGYDDYTSWKSTTGDFDSERLWSSAMDDFSFFGNEECGVPEPHEEIAMNILNKQIHQIPSEDAIDSIHFTHSVLSELEGSTAAASSTTRDNNGLRKRFQLASGQPDFKKGRSPDAIEEPDVDLVSALATFRRTKKKEFEELQRVNRQQVSPTSHGSDSKSDSPSSSSSPPLNSQTAHYTPLPLHVEGHWSGEVKVIRNFCPKGRSGVVDIYGNYFEKGYLYP